MLIVFSRIARADGKWRTEQQHRNGVARDAANLIRSGVKFDAVAGEVGYGRGALRKLMMNACPPFAEQPGDVPTGRRSRAPERYAPPPVRETYEMVLAKNALTHAIEDARADLRRGEVFRMRATDWGPTKHGIER